MNERGTAADDGLRLKPFRGLRYVPERVRSLAAVTSPPYDVVVRPDGLDHLESSDPYNIVRLILPQAPTADARPRRAADTLADWLEDGVLAPDAEPALYVYEQRKGDLLQRGLIGALELSPPAEGVVLPHEDVMPHVVEERADLMRTTGAHLEPLLLTYRCEDRASGTAAVIERATAGTPLLSTTTEDGFDHRLWAVTDPAELTAVADDLADHQALIADGHHRWATYLRLREERSGPGPWNYGLVLLVDTGRYPLRVRAIHRLLHRLPVASALAALDGGSACGRWTAYRWRRPWTPWRRRRTTATRSCWRATAASTWWTAPPRTCWSARCAGTGRRRGGGWTRRCCTRRCWSTCGGSPTPRSTSPTSTTRGRR